jgi:Icc-related predicted phosphoesterase
MDILLTADLHSKLTWFGWLESQAEKYELIGIAGDLLDLFSSVDPKTQSIAATAFLRRLSGKTKVAVCSGNHDSIDYLANTRAAAPLWLSELRGIKNLITDGQTECVKNSLVVTTLPHIDAIDPLRVLLLESSTIAREKQIPWLVLNHIPPAMKATDAEEAKAVMLIKEFQPSYWFSGHVHNILYDGGTWKSQLGKTTLLNAGQRLDAKIPNYIIFGVTTGEVRASAG